MEEALFAAAVAQVVIARGLALALPLEPHTRLLLVRVAQPGPRQERQGSAEETRSSALLRLMVAAGVVFTPVEAGQQVPALRADLEAAVLGERVAAQEIPLIHLRPKEVMVVADLPAPLCLGRAVGVALVQQAGTGQAQLQAQEATDHRQPFLALQ